MTTPEILPYDPRSVPFGQRCAVRIASGLAALLGRQSPALIRRTLGWLRRGAKPAAGDEVQRIRDAVVAVSLPCSGPYGCVRRSLAIVLLTRTRGGWATWCVGARKIPPFAGHAWVEVDGKPVGEDVPEDYLRPLIKVSPAKDA